MQGTWPDIDYGNKGRADWLPGAHPERLLELAQVWRSPGSNSTGSPDVLNALQLALSFWIRADLQSPNWWWNEIAVPQYLSKLLLLTAGHLTPSNSAGTVTITERATWWDGWTGSNLVWMVEVQARRCLYTGNVTGVEGAFRRLWQEVFLAHQGSDGIQLDSSFHQHSTNNRGQLLAGSYGSVYTSLLLPAVGYAAGTSVAMPANATELFARLIAEGQAWMIPRTTWDINVIGRQVTGPTHGGYGVGWSTYWMRQLPVSGALQHKVVALANRLDGNASSTEADYCIGHRHYYDSDYTVTRRPEWVASVKMYSNRTITARCVNSQAKMSQHASDGVMFVYRTGHEYDDAAALWDWQRLPGTLEQHGAPYLPCEWELPVNYTTFVGGVSDGSTGMSVMNLSTNLLRAHRTWFALEDAIVTVNTGIYADGTLPSGNSIVSTFDARLLNGPVTVGTAGGPANGTILPAGNYSFNPQSKLGTLLWIHHDGVGYLPMGDLGAVKAVNLSAGTRYGDWSNIGVSTGVLKRDFFEAWAVLEVGAGKPDGESFAYAVLPNVTAGEVAAAAASGLAGVELQEINADAQSVVNTSSRTVYAAVWSRYGGSVTAGGPAHNISIETDGAALVQVAGPDAHGNLTVSVAAPDQSGGGVRVGVRVNTSTKSTGTAALPDCQPWVGHDGFVQLNFTLPVGDSMGDTVSTSCRYVSSVHSGR